MNAFNRGFIPFSVATVASYYLHRHALPIFLLMLPFISLGLLRLLVSNYFQDKTWFAIWVQDIKQGWWYLLGLSLVFVSLLWFSPDSLFLQSADLPTSVLDIFYIATSPFKAMGMLLFTGVLLLESFAPRQIIKHYWLSRVHHSGSYTEWLKQWQSANKSNYYKGLYYVTGLYAVALFCPVILYWAWIALIGFYERGMDEKVIV